MRKILVGASELLTFDAVYVTKDEKRYTVEELYINRSGSLYGLRVSEDGLLRKNSFVCGENIGGFAKNTVLINGVQKAKAVAFKKLQFAFSDLFMTVIHVEDGSVLGNLSDVYFNIEDLSVMAVEISRSFFEDLLDGRIIVPGNIEIAADGSIVISRLQLEYQLHNAKGIVNVINNGIRKTEKQ